MDLREIVSLILVGLFIGVLAKLFTSGRQPGGFVVTTVVGIAGSFVGSWLGGVLGFRQTGAASWLITSVLGAMLLLWLSSLALGRTRR